MRIELDRVSVGHGDVPVLPDLHLDIADGSMVGLIGPNGCGKSTLLHTIGGLLPPLAGVVRLDGVDRTRIPPRERARRLAMLPQAPATPPGLTVRELVMLGRHPHRPLFGRGGPQDAQAVTEALELTDLTGFADRPVEGLSGGERQRVWMAMTIAQAAGTVLLDEPTTFLDLGHQFELLELVASLREQRELTVVVVLHDLHQAARFCERLVVLGDGRVRADGSPAEVLTAAIFRDVLGIEGHLRTEDGLPYLVPLRSVAGSTVVGARAGAWHGRVHDSTRAGGRGQDRDAGTPSR
jgi:iron complex transport system ATP-binding protein